ncbi:fructose-1,6-bisphosphatase [Lactococcus termiticola]|nr:fructose-1,6-bisphosphatase [Lactococcus termiticola]
MPSKNQEKYYRLLKEAYPSREKVLTEIINLSAICELPKATEHFMSDVHGEYRGFDSVLRRASGGIKEKLRERFPSLSFWEVEQISAMISYPEETLSSQEAELSAEAFEDWGRQMLQHLLRATYMAGEKYSRSKLRKALPEQFSYILEELLTELESTGDRHDYFQAIVNKLQELDQLKPLLIALSDSIRRLSIDQLHIVGDIYDRGPYPDKIIDELIAFPSVDIQWGNHDIAWMAIMAGSKLAMVNVIRISARYGNLEVLENSYGVNLRPLMDYSSRYYRDAEKFAPRLPKDTAMSGQEKSLLNRLQQATAMLQFKLESQLIHRRPDFKMAGRDLLYFIDIEKGLVELNGRDYPLHDFQAPTIDWNRPNRLTAEEESLLDLLMENFLASVKLRKHVDFLLEKGGMYLKYNGNLLIHGCLPLEEDGSYKAFELEGKSYAGKSLLDFFDGQVRLSMQYPETTDDLATDLMWYLWTGESSSLFGKEAMTTFERYYIEDKATHHEKKNPYYQLRENRKIIEKILADFGLDPEKGHLINGHTPVHEKDGENPIKAEGKMIVIDGGFSKPYQAVTGRAGYTLLCNSWGLQLAVHNKPEGELDQTLGMITVKRLVDKVDRRQRVKDTTIGQQLLEEIKDLEYLYANYEKY